MGGQRCVPQTLVIMPFYFSLIPHRIMSKQWPGELQMATLCDNSQCAVRGQSIDQPWGGGTCQPPQEYPQHMGESLHWPCHHIEGGRSCVPQRPGYLYLCQLQSLTLFEQLPSPKLYKQSTTEMSFCATASTEGGQYAWYDPIRWWGWHQDTLPHQVMVPILYTCTYFWSLILPLELYFN